MYFEVSEKFGSKNKRAIRESNTKNLVERDVRMNV